MEPMQDKGVLADEIEALTKSRPFHMPGHKRRVFPAKGLPIGIDVTEITGADDLHHAEGILAALWSAPRGSSAPRRPTTS